MPESSTAENGSTKFQVDRITDGERSRTMVDSVMEGLPEARLFAALHTYRNVRLNPDRDTKSFSLADMRLSRFSDKTDNPVIEPVIGSLLVKGSLAESRMGRFYTPNRVFRREDGAVELRGANYFVSRDFEKRRPYEKMDSIEKDFRDGLSVIDQMERPQSEQEFLMYLGVLDYLKIHSLSLLHAVTYDERNIQIPSNPAEVAEYTDLRRKAIDLTRASTRKFYQAACGLPYDEGLDFGSMERDMTEILSYLRKNSTDDDFRKFLPYPDVNNPATVMVGAHEAGLQNPDVQTIVGLASGGTESAIATQLFYEYTHGYAPELVILPISFHPYKGEGDKPTLPKLKKMTEQIYPDAFADKSVLLVDDNSSSGDTIQITDDLARSLGATVTEAHIAEHNPARILRTLKKSKEQYRRVFNIDHPKHRTTVGVLPEDSRFGDRYVTEIAHRLHKYYAGAQFVA